MKVKKCSQHSLKFVELISENKKRIYLRIFLSVEHRLAEINY